MIISEKRQFSSNNVNKYKRNVSSSSEGKMGEKWDKFLLLMWKNWILQYRRPIQTLIEILAPVLFSFLLVVIRSLVDPELRDAVNYSPFCTIPVPISIEGVTFCPDVVSNADSGDFNISNFSNYSVMYSPRSEGLSKVMSFFNIPFANVTELEDSKELVRHYNLNSDNNIFAAIQFDDSYKGLDNLDGIKDFKVSIRFPGETRLTLDPFGKNDWKTNLLYPVFQIPGPRRYSSQTGADPSYFMEGFLAVQHFLAFSTILAKNNLIWSEGGDNSDVLNYLLTNPPPLLNMRRFPNAEWYEDFLLTALQSMLGIIIMLSFVYTCINTVKSITTEKEKQLKESMKIMGLANWLHWTAWFVKTFIFLLISIILIVVMLKVRWYKNTDFTVFTYADPSVMLVFLIFYICSIITFCFAVSVFFSKANTAATIAGLTWFLSYSPYIFLQQNYDSLSLSTKLLASLGGNTAMAFGFQLMLMFEGTAEGIQWSNVFKPNSPDDSLTLGLIMIMLIIDTFIYLIIALYIETVFPGEYGVPKPWYFPFTASFWCGKTRAITVEDLTVQEQEKNTKEGQYFETEPHNLHAGVQIRNLRKDFHNKTAVRNLSLNMYEDQITVLLGHNGAGKTTTMSMLTGMITASGGTAKVNGYDIRTEMGGVRKSIGLCPQHNIIFDDLTVSEHLYFFSKLKGLSKHEIKAETDKYVSLLELEPKRNSKSSTLSGGMKRKLCVAMALCGKSKVIMLDEPTAGMDPSARRALWDLIQTEKEGRTMLLTTHFMDEADLLGDRIAIMAGGELQCCGSSFFLKKKYGAGYSLIMDKHQSCDAGKVTELLRKHISDIEVHTNIGSELTYLLAESQSTKFESMLRDLELNSNKLGILSYGISLTTLEEVFMKVGADHGQEEIYNDTLAPNGFHNDESTKLNLNNINGEVTVNVNLRPTYTSGWSIIQNQLLAMFLKKILSTYRSWVLLLIQILIPSVFLIIAMAVTWTSDIMGDLPAMRLNLGGFENTITLVESNGNAQYSQVYENFLKGQNYETKSTTNMIDEMMSLTKEIPASVRRHYLVGASFENMTVANIPISNVTAWFNNDPYHTPGITLSFMLNTMYRMMLGCEDCSIEFTNAPLPFTAETQITQILNSNSVGFQLSFNIGFSMAFVSSFYILFVIRENISKSKHLQFVSGVKVLIFWITAAICDMITYLITVIVLLITLVAFQEDGFKSPEEIGRMFLILFYFGWAFIPLEYLAGFLFSVPATGYTRMSLFSIFAGNAAFLVVQVLSTPGLNLEYVGKALHWVFLIVPHYSLSTGISESYTLYSYNKLCNSFYELCRQVCPQCSQEQCLITSPQYLAICDGVDDNYFKWEAHGIGRNIFYSFTIGLVLFLILLIIEYKLFARLIYYIRQKYFSKYPTDIENEDSDVAAEKEKIRNTPINDLLNNHALVLRDLTKYYKNFMAVNGLCLGIKNYECFGLLGINGAGKTTTFKMMTGDVHISYGDGWVNGLSIKSQIKNVQKSIGYCPQFDALLDDMTARETIKMFALLRGIAYEQCNDVADILAHEFDFIRHLDKKVKELSGGNKRKLSTSISLIGDPPVIYLDEPTTGMDPATKRYLWNAFCKVRDSGKCIVLTSHSMEECEALCTRLAIMVNGHFKCLGSTQHLKHKFAEGYTLTIKVKKQSEVQIVDTEPIERFIQQHFPGAKIREKHQELINYYITDKSVPWSKMFGILETGKRGDLNIEDYSLGQSSLEQVFLTFTKQQYITDLKK